MLTRRGFLGTGVAGSLAAFLITPAVRGEAASGVPIEAPAPAAEPVPQRSGTTRARRAADRVPLHAVLFDERFAEAVRFGNEARRRGLPARGVRGDLTDFWLAELHPLWRRQARPIAGLTAYAALFCLERLAWDHRMRVVYHGALAPLAVADFAALLARIESRRGWGGLPCAPPAAEPRSPAGCSAPLHAWVIAPAARAPERV